jgi:predicted RNase H-like HicB family nuclease
MKKKRFTLPYLVRLYWSDEDDAFVAQVPALPGCVAHGATMAKAGREIEIAMRLWLESAHAHGEPIPEPDLAREEIERVSPFLNVSKLAARAGLNKHTLASKLRRKSPFSAVEAKAILKALEPV